MINIQVFTDKEIKFIKNLLKWRLDKLLYSDLNYSPNFKRIEQNSIEMIINKINMNISNEKNIV